MTGNGDLSSTLFSDFTVGSLTTANRFVMAPMTREFAIGGVPSPQAAEYYARRARGGIGLIITEGTVVDHGASAASKNVPRFYGEDALTAWRGIAQAVHREGGKIIPQLWHVGLDRDPANAPYPDAPTVGPTSWFGSVDPSREILSQGQIDEIIDAFARAATAAERLGFDGIELHGGHGYLIDNFLWSKTNSRADAYGGTIIRRSRFASEVVSEIRARVSPQFPIFFRLSQWKTIDFDARPFATPSDLKEALTPLVDAGVSAFHASTRRFWLPEFAGSERNLAGWVRHVTGLPTITVGSVGLDGSDFVGTLANGNGARPGSFDRVSEMIDRGDFDLVAIGRALVSDPLLIAKLRRGNLHERRPFNANDLTSLS